MAIQQLSCILVGILFLHKSADGLHLVGAVSERDLRGSFSVILARFGFQQAGGTETAKTIGYAYGNITASTKDNSFLMVLVDEDVYKVLAKTIAYRSCNTTLAHVDTVAYDSKCMKEGPEDLYRKVPCPTGQLCTDEDAPTEVLHGYQFTYRVQQKNRPRFWFLIVLPCQLDEKCQWKKQFELPPLTHYDIWLVNGSPDVKYRNPFEHQFSFDDQDLAEIYICYSVIFVALLALQLRSVTLSAIHRSKLLLSVIIIESIGLSAAVLHLLVFAKDGVGLVGLRLLGDGLLEVAQMTLMFLLLLLARGWTPGKRPVRWRLTALVWGSYAIFHLSLNFYQSVLAGDKSQLANLQTWPDWCQITARLCLALWFILEIRLGLLWEYEADKRSFLLHFGAGFAMWFAYWPLIKAFAYNIPEIWRLKITVAIRLLADSMACALLIHLFWPKSSNRRFFTENVRVSLSVRFGIIAMTVKMHDHGLANLGCFFPLKEELDDFEREVLFSDAINQADETAFDKEDD